MADEKPRFEIDDSVLLAKKPRKPKYEWDIEVIEEAARRLAAEPRVTIDRIIHDILEDMLTPKQLPDIFYHKRRILIRLSCRKSA